MAVVQTVKGDLSVQGIVYAQDGIQPPLTRAGLLQETLAVYPIPMTWWRVWDVTNYICNSSSEIARYYCRKHWELREKGKNGL